MARFEPIYAYVILPGTVIDWQAVVFNSLWIVGLALLLAAFSYHYWAARQAQTKLRIQLNEPAFSSLFWLSFVLVCAGLAGTSPQTLETVIWLALAGCGLLFMVRAITLYRSAKVTVEKPEGFN